MFNKKRIEELEKKLEGKIEWVKALAFEAKFPDGEIFSNYEIFSRRTYYFNYSFLNKLHNIMISNNNGYNTNYKVIENNCEANTFVIEKRYEEQSSNEEKIQFIYKYFLVDKETEAISDITNIYNNKTEEK